MERNGLDGHAQAALALLRSARRLTAELGVVRDLESTLEAVVAGIADIGFEGAVLNLATECGDLEVVAVAGPPDLDALLGVVESRPKWEALLGSGQRWGSLVFVPAAADAGVRDTMSTWYQPTTLPGDPDGWREGDDLFAPMHDATGALIGVLSVGEPHHHRLPTPHERELLEMYAAHAGGALENALLRERTEQALAAAELERRRLQAAFALSPTAVAWVDQDGSTLRHVNQAFCDLLGYSAEEVVGVPLIDLVHVEDRAAAAKAGGEGLRDVERRYRHRDGSVRWVKVWSVDVPGDIDRVIDPEDVARIIAGEPWGGRTSASGADGAADVPDPARSTWGGVSARPLLRSLAGSDELRAVPGAHHAGLGGAAVRSRMSGAGRLIASVRPPLESQPRYRLFHLLDITATKEREEVLQHQAEHDPLTGLLNRRGLGDVVAAYRRAPSRPVGVLFVDLDDFKEVNDSLGHEAGDVVLVEFAHRLRSTARSHDAIARMGGDEFVILATDVDEVSVWRLAQRLVDSMAEPFDVARRGLVLGVSVGVCCGRTGHDLDRLVATADRLMLERKAARRAAGQARGRPSAR